jgi:hypothetical protein
LASKTWKSFFKASVQSWFNWRKPAVGPVKKKIMIQNSYNQSRSSQYVMLTFNLHARHADYIKDYPPTHQLVSLRFTHSHEVHHSPPLVLFHISIPVTRWQVLELKQVIWGLLSNSRSQYHWKLCYHDPWLTETVKKVVMFSPGWTQHFPKKISFVFFLSEVIQVIQGNWHEYGHINIVHTFQ